MTTYMNNFNPYCGWNNFNYNTPYNFASFPTFPTMDLSWGNVVSSPYSKTTNTGDSKTVTQEDITNSWKAGKNLYNTIDGRTKDEEYANIDATLKSLNKHTVFSFISGYYEAKGGTDCTEGIFEHLDDEHDGGAITMGAKLNFIKSVIDAAKMKGLDKIPGTCDIVEELENIYNQYSTGDLKDAKDFNHNGEVTWGSVGAHAGTQAAAGAGIGAIVSSWTVVGVPVCAAIGAGIGTITGAITGCFDQTTDNERIDEHIKTLLQALG